MLKKNNQLCETAGDVCNGGFFIKVLWIITAVSLLLRLTAAWEMLRAFNGVNNVVSPLPSSDLHTYMELGAQCASGEFPPFFDYQPWYYAVFLAIIKFFFGTCVYPVIIIQALFSAATVWLTGWCGRKIFSEKAGLIAAGICAISSSLILYVPFHQNETLQTFHLIALLSLTLIALEKRCCLMWAVVGLLAGIAILTRGNIILLIPVIAGGLIYYEIKNEVKWKTVVVHLLVFLAMLTLIQIPFAWRNTVYSGELSGPSIAANKVLALGNTVEAPAGGREPGSSAGAMVYPEAYNRMMKNTEGIFGRSVPQQMWQWLCDDPAAFCELQFRKALLFWDGREIPNNVSLEYDGVMVSRVLQILFIGRNCFLFALGAAGILWFAGKLKRKKSPGLMLIYGFMFTFYAAVVIFYLLSRFKAPAIPLLALFGGGAVDSWIITIKSAEKEKRLIICGKVAIFLLLGFWLSFSAYDSYRDCEAAVNRIIYPDGIVLDMQGENIHHFDYGPQPFGGWSYEKLMPGMKITKKFAKLDQQQVLLAFMVASVEPVKFELSVNNVPYYFELPAVQPGKSERKMLPLNATLSFGTVEIKVISATSDIYAVYDCQRVYDRSALNGYALDGEWVIRAIVQR